jgi:tetratricopeptide (TPR) repeat protein
MESGKRMMEKKDYPRAAIQFINAIKVMPKDAEPYYQLGLVYLAQRNYVAAARSFQGAVALDPKHQQAQLKLAEMMAASGQKQVVEKAQQKVHELLNAGQSNAEILDVLAATEWKLNDPQDAEKHLEEAFSKFPKSLASAVDLARVKQAHHDLTGAENVLKIACAQKPPSANAFLALGQFYVSAGRGDDAEAQFRRAIEIDPKSGPAVLSLAVLQTRAGKLDEAEQTYRRLSALPDKQYKLYHADFLAARGKSDQAIAEFKELNRLDPDDRATRSSLVRAYLSAHKTEEAEKLVTEVLHKNPKDADALMERGTIYLLAGRLGDAETDLSKALHFKADSPETHYLMAKVHQMRGRVQSQRSELGEALRLQPDYLRARVQLCLILIASGAAQPALDLMNGTPGPQKNSLAYLVSRNWALLALHQTAEVRKEVNRGLAAVRAPELLLQDAYLKLELKDYAPAQASLAEALDKSPEDLRILRMIAASYTEQKRPADALRHIQEYASQHPKSAPVQQFLAELFIANRRPAEARMALLAAKAANPNFTLADISLARLDLNEGRANEAMKTLSAVLVQTPNNVPARALAASVEDMLGNRTAAIDAYKKILEIQPDNVLALNNLAYDLAEYANQPDEGLKYAQKAVELAPDAPAVDNTLGWVLYHKGMYGLALPHLERAAEKDPTARHKCHLAMAYFKMGDQERGQKNLDAAVKLDPNISEIKAAQQMSDEMK